MPFSALLISLTDISQDCRLSNSTSKFPIGPRPVERSSITQIQIRSARASRKIPIINLIFDRGNIQQDWESNSWFEIEIFFFFAQIARKSKDLIFSKNIDKKVRLDFEGFLTLIRITIDFSRVFLHCMNFYELKKIYMAVKWIITAFLFFKTLCIHILHSYGNIWNLKFKPPIGNNVECNRGSIENYNRINLCIQKFLYHWISRKNRRGILWIKGSFRWIDLPNPSDSVHDAEELSNNHASTNFLNHSIVYGGMERRDTGQ